MCQFSRIALWSVSFAAMVVGLSSAAAAQTEEQQQDQTEEASVSLECSEILDAAERQACILRVEGRAGDESPIVVTGTRIRSPQYELANPVVSVDSAAIQNAGVTNLTGFLSDMPSLVGSFDANDASGSEAGIGFVGLNLLNLRNLGIDRTLVLVDGRRHVSAVPGSAAVDVNTIPIDLIQRVDILTGGASAVYGADAVTGVVNFVMKRDFEGINMRGQAGISEVGDAGNQFLSVVAGKNFADGRANVAVALEYGHDDRLHVRNRRQLARSRSFGLNPADPNDDPNIPDNIPWDDVRYFDSHATSAIDVDLDLVPEFIGDGSPFIHGTYIGGINESGGSGTLVSTYQGEILPEVDRYVGNLLFNYEVSDTISVYAEGKYARVDSLSEGQPTFDFTILVTPENPFLPSNVANIIADNFGIAVVNRDNLDIGLRGEDNIRETWRGVLGLRAGITPNIDFDISYVYGRSENTVHQTRTRFTDRFLAAIDVVRDPVTGSPICRSNREPIGNSDQPFYNFGQGFFFDDFDELSFSPGPGSGCVPFNLFSEQQAPGAIEWLLTDAIDRSTIQQHVVSASVTGDFGERLRLWGDKIDFAVGAEYRKEKSESKPDPVNTTGLTFGNALFPEVGSYDVKEIFAELRVPIIEDRPFFETLSVNGAVRLSDYSTVGSTTTFQIGANWAPVRDLRLRGTYSQAVRAPNISELFGPQNQTFLFVSDPCNPLNVDDGTGFRQANCTALLNGLGLSPAQIAAFTGNTSSSIPGTAGGNADLREETAKTITAGIVFQPRFLPGFTASADFYDVKIEDAVSSPSLQTIANLCVDQPTLDNVFCEAIDRNPGSVSAAPGVIVGFRLQPQNVAQFRTRGFDLAANYRTALGDLGALNVRLVGNILDRLEFIPTPGADVVNSKNTLEAPRYQVNGDITWSYDDFQLNWGFNYFSRTRRFSRLTEENEPDLVPPEFMRYDARFTHDIQASVNVADRMTLYGGVNNVFGQRPDVGQFFYPVSAVGRFFYFGARLNFGAF